MSESESKAVENQVSQILKPTLQDNDFLQSFVRIGLEDKTSNLDKCEKNEGEKKRSSRMKNWNNKVERLDPTWNESGHILGSSRTSSRSYSRLGILNGNNKMRHGLRRSVEEEMKEERCKMKKRRRRSEIALRQEEVYTDKDRAAAVNMGTKDIKQSLKIKRRQDRSRTLQIPDEADPGAILALAHREMRASGDINIAIQCIDKALELSPNDKKALIARSQCHLQLGSADKALADAESALEKKMNDMDKSKAIYCKAEALYHLGDFEMSLVYYYRGKKIRPECHQFRLGVQKAKEAIESILNGPSVRIAAAAATLRPEKTSFEKIIKVNKKVHEKRRKKWKRNKKFEANLLGQLSVDKKYLQNFIKQPDVKAAHQDSAEHITIHAEEGVKFLKTRQEFWRQQRAAVE